MLYTSANALTLAVDSTDRLTRASYKYLVDNGYKYDGTYTYAGYTSSTDLIIEYRVFTGTNGYFAMDAVLVKEVDSESDANKADSGDDDDDELSTAGYAAAIAAALLSGVGVLILIVMCVLQIRQNRDQSLLKSSAAGDKFSL